LRYSAEAESLRERALVRIVAGAMLGSSEAAPVRVRDLAALISKDGPTLRTEVVKSTLDKLVTVGEVGFCEVRKKRCYYLTEQGRSKIENSTTSAETLYSRALDRVLENLDVLMPRETGEIVFRAFISECFIRFGRQLARAVTGTTTAVARSFDVEAAFRAATTNIDIADGAINSLRARCSEFLISREPDDIQLKFSLAQGYYIAELLGTDSGGFDPIAEGAFRGAKFYLDTNVIVPRLIGTEGKAGDFDEVVSIAKRLEISLLVTRATINEARRVAADRRAALDKVIAKYPSEVLKASVDDEFLEAFIAKRENDPRMTVETFLAPFDILSTMLGEIGIQIDDRTESEVLTNDEYDRIAKRIQEACLQTRGWEKPDGVLRHDAFHLLAVQAARSVSPKVWFLTNDRSLVLAGASLVVGDGRSLVYSVLGFLQSISPFVPQSDEPRIMDVFSSFFHDHVRTSDGKNLFGIEELRLIAEYHEDVLSTPAHQLVLALDYAKSAVLEGKPYRVDSCSKFALGLKKFLNSSAEERQALLAAEVERHEREARQAREELAATLDQQDRESKELRERHSQELREAKARETDARAEHETLSARVSAMETLISQMNANTEQERLLRKQVEQARNELASKLATRDRETLALTRQNHKLGRILLGVGAVLALVAFLIEPWFARRSGIPEAPSDALRIVIFLGFTAACGRLVMQSLPRLVTGVGLTAAIAVAILVAGVLSDGSGSKLSNALQVASIPVGIAMVARRRRSGGDADSEAQEM